MKSKDTRCLNDENVVRLASQDDVRHDVDSCREGVDTGSQSFAADVTALEIDSPGICGGAQRRVGVRGLHVEDRLGQDCRCGHGHICTIGVSLDLRGRCVHTCRVHFQAKAGHGCRGNGRDAHVTDDGGVRHRGDAALCKDDEVLCISKLDRFSISASIDRCCQQQRKNELHRRFG